MARFFFTLYAARVLGVEQFGQYGFALALIAFFSIVSDFGINNYQTRQTAIDNDVTSTKSLLANSLISRLILSSIAVIIILLITLFLQKPINLKIFLYLLTVSMIVNCLGGSFVSVLLGYERFKQYSILAIMTQFIATLLGFMALFFGFGLLGIGTSNIITAVLSLIIIGAVINKTVCRVSFTGHIKNAFKIIKQAAPLGITAILITVYYRADFIMLSLMKNDQAVGYYNSAYALVNGLLLVSSTFSLTLLPRMSGYFSRDPERLNLLYRSGFKYLLFFGLALASGATILAVPIYEFIYPHSYLPGAIALKILIWALALMFINSLQNALMIASDMKKWLMYIAGAGAFVNIILNFILIPLYGFKGAAVATVISEILTASGFLIILRHNLPLRVITGWLARLIPAIALMALIVFYLPGMMVLLRVAIGAIVFGVTLILTGGLNRDDFKTVMGLLSWGRE